MSTGIQAKLQEVLKSAKEYIEQDDCSCKGADYDAMGHTVADAYICDRCEILSMIDLGENIVEVELSGPVRVCRECMNERPCVVKISPEVPSELFNEQCLLTLDDDAKWHKQPVKE